MILDHPNLYAKFYEAVWIEVLVLVRIKIEFIQMHLKRTIALALVNIVQICRCHLELIEKTIVEIFV